MNRLVILRYLPCMLRLENGNCFRFSALSYIYVVFNAFRLMKEFTLWLKFRYTILMSFSFKRSAILHFCHSAIVESQWLCAVYVHLLLWFWKAFTILFLPFSQGDGRIFNPFDEVADSWKFIEKLESTVYIVVIIDPVNNEVRTVVQNQLTQDSG